MFVIAYVCMCVCVWGGGGGGYPVYHCNAVRLQSIGHLLPNKHSNRAVIYLDINGVFSVIILVDVKRITSIVGPQIIPPQYTVYV